MKIINPATAIYLVAILFMGCNKSDKKTTVEEATIIENIATNAASDEALLSDDQLVLEASIPANLAEVDIASIANDANNCPTTTVTPKSGFPRTIVIDYGSSCTQNGVKRSGKTITVLSGLRSNPGSTAVTTFENFFINDVHKEGTITWTNTSTLGTRSWQNKLENVKMTTADGKFTIHNGVRDVQQIDGMKTPNNTQDDGFSITGSGTVTNSQLVTRKHTILTALERYNNCKWIDKGSIKTESANHYVIVDYGDGKCDQKATVSKDGGLPKEIKLN